MAVARRIQIINDASVPLPSFSLPGLPVGFIIADTTGQNWQLTVSSALVNHTSVEACAGNPGLRWLTYSGGGGGGFPASATALTKDNTGTPSANIPLSGLAGPGLLQFAADGTPTKATAANLAAAYLSGASLLNEVITAGGTVQDLPLTTVGWTTNGDTDGQFIYDGTILVPAASAGFSYFLQPNALGTNQAGEVVIAAGVGPPTSAALTSLFIGSGCTNAGRLSFKGAFEAKSGRVRHWTCTALTFDPTAVTNVKRDSVGEWNASATVMDGTTRIHCDNAGGIVTGSFVKVVRTGMAA